MPRIFPDLMSGTVGGIAVSATERPEDLGELLSAVERFEAAVEARGGDLMVDDLRSSEPDDRHFVVPRRGSGETVRAYIVRIDEAEQARLSCECRPPVLPLPAHCPSPRESQLSERL